MSLFYCIPWCRFLDPGDQIIAKGFTETVVFNGPGMKCIGPCYPGERRKATTLTKQQYVKIRDQIAGTEKIEKGPQLYYLAAYEQLVDSGPVNGESLGPTDFMKIIDNKTGQLSIIKGPALWMPDSPFQKIVQRYTAQALKVNEFIKIIDNSTGKIRVVQGEALVYLSETEEFLTPVTPAVNIDELTAVVVRNTKTGQLSLVTEKKLFAPKADEVIEKTLKKMVLEEHQMAILRDKDGAYIFKGGRGKKTEDRSFFIPPYCEMVSLHWYQEKDLSHKGNESENVSIFDLRPQFLTYQFVCRTCDNVELVLDLTFFWELQDIEKMIHMTGDLPGDICSHARSMIIQEVATVTLEKFMSEFNQIIRKAVIEKDDPFYVERGAKLHSVEVRSIHCKDPNTEKVLQEIIKETTDRLNRLQKQSSENEVKLYSIKGEIEAEKMKADLIRIRHDHKRAQAIMEGEARADNIKAFLKGLEGATVPYETQFDMWQSLRKVETVKNLANTGSQMYFTPNDLSLSMENMVSTNVPAKKPATTKTGK